MRRTLRRTIGTFLLVGGVALATLPAGANNTTTSKKEAVPKGKHEAIGGSVVGVLVLADQALLDAEGITAPPNSLFFSTGGNSYRFFYVPEKEKPLIGGLRVKDAKGDTKRFDFLSIPTTANMKRYGISAPYTLVEVEANGGAGSAPGDAFVATDVKIVEGSPQYPLKAAEIVAQVRQQHMGQVRQQESSLEQALQETQKKALKDRKPTGPRERTDLVYVSWLPESKRLKVILKTRLSDGAYKSVDMTEYLKVHPHKPFLEKPKAVRYGTSFGVEVGMAFEVGRNGKIEQSSAIPIESFVKEIPMPSGTRYTKKD